jgi:hypothetical protein
MTARRSEQKSGLPAWEKPEVMELGSLASGRGQDHKCQIGAEPGHICGNGMGATISQCKSGNNPPSNSCASGANGS